MPDRPSPQLVIAEIDAAFSQWQTLSSQLSRISYLVSEVELPTILQQKLKQANGNYELDIFAAREEFKIILIRCLSEIKVVLKQDAQPPEGAIENSQPSSKT